jgi:hypothetical protein
MTAIWHDDGTGWHLLAPTGFTAEAALHNLVEAAPQMLPLAGSPRLVIIGREVTLGSGKADLLAVEPSGRLAIIEIKLAQNTEARRAVVAQVLAYAAFLRGWDAIHLEQQVLAEHLQKRSYPTLADAVKGNDQEGSFDAASFGSTLAESLALGSFRLVFVLDDAPADLIRLVGYLEAVTERLTIDLVTVAAYNIGGTQALVPQRVETGQVVTVPSPNSPPSGPLPTGGGTGWLANGAEDFEQAISAAPLEHQQTFMMLCDWAKGLATRGRVKLSTYHGKTGQLTLLPRLLGEDVGLVTIWNAQGVPSISLWRSVFERLAPECIPQVEQAIAPVSLGQGKVVTQVGATLLSTLTNAYEIAAAKLRLGTA